MYSTAVLALLAGSFATSVAAQAQVWQQCGGQNWTGATTCVAGSSCVVVNDYYYQCQPSSSTTKATTTTSSKAATTTSTRPGGTSTLSTSTRSTTTSASASSSTSATPSGGTGAWSSALSKAKTSLAKLSQQNKIDIVTGLGWQKGEGCVGNTKAVSAIGYPQLCLQDSPLGLRYLPQSTAWPAGIQAGATWDRDLIYARGLGLGQEAKAAGIHVQLGPVAGPLGKIPTAGRNWEGFSNDPYLSGQAMISTINGMQSGGVQTSSKHFILNEQELNRETMNSIIDDRTLHELYLWPFADAVWANTTSVMCSYNKVNGSWACENDRIMNQILKQELNFQGYIMSDWNAQHSTVASANTGLDMTMPGTDFSGGSLYWGQNLLTAVNSGQVSQSRLDDMVVRILAAWYLVGQDQGYPSVTWSSWSNPAGQGAPNTQTATNKAVARQVAADGIVLLKNSNKVLPLSKSANLALIGSDAVVNPSGANACTDRACNTGHLAMGWGSGTAQFPYLVAPYDGIKSQSTGTITLSSSDDATAGANAAVGKKAALVFITADSGEGYLTVEGNAGDRNNLDPWHSGNALVQAVAAKNNNTIVVVNSVGPIILETILAQPNVTAVVWAGLGGQESGNGLADILFGAKSPSGKLPYTIAKTASDYGTQITSGSDSYTEGLYIDYRRFDQNSITPRYEFGFGLSYSTFDYSGLKATYSDKTAGDQTAIPGGKKGLFDTVATVTATVTNNGTVAAAEVAQLYIGIPGGNVPSKQLRGFQKFLLQPGASSTATFNIRRKDLSTWDVASQSWKTPTGTFQVYVGSSSRDIRLTGTM